MQRFRSCLVVLIGFILLVLLVVFGSRAYVRWHMAQVSHDLFTVAGQLGYTPDALLQHRVNTRDFNFIFPWDTYCDVALYYTTAMSTAEFSERLNKVLPRTRGRGQAQTSPFTLSFIPNLKVDGSARDDTDAFLLSQQAPVTRYEWVLTQEKYDGYVAFYQTAGVHKRLEYKERLVAGNIVELGFTGGRYPVWMGCPASMTEVTSLPPN
jgi:hypothetical protein